MGQLQRRKGLVTKKGLKRTPFSASSTRKGPGLKRTTGLARTGPIKPKEGAVGLIRTSGLKRGFSQLKSTKVLHRSVSTEPREWKAIEPNRQKGLNRTVRIKADPRLIREAQLFHDAVWALFGDRCVLCTRPHPAVAAAHVIKRSKLGKLRYADPRLARPAHWDCHAEQEANRRPFSLEIRIDATRAYNKITKTEPMIEPVL